METINNKNGCNTKISSGNNVEIPSQNEIFSAKELAARILKMELEKQKLKNEKKDRLNKMKEDKKDLSEVFQVIGSTRPIKNEEGQWTVKNVPNQWYKKKGLKLIYQAIENILGAEAKETFIETVKERKRKLYEEIPEETTISIKSIKDKEVIKTKKPKKEKDYTKAKQAQYNRIINKLKKKT
jgi:hypothetical protein